MAKQIHLILGVSIVLLGVVLCTGILQTDEGFKVRPTDYQLELRSTRENVDNLQKSVNKEKHRVYLRMKDLASLTDQSNVIKSVYAISGNNDLINNINLEIFNRMLSLARSSQREADRLRTDSSRNDALEIEKSAASRGDAYASDAAAIVITARTVAVKADANLSSIRQAHKDALTELKVRQSELDTLNKKYNSARSASSSAKSVYDSILKNFNDAGAAYKKALDTQRSNKKSKVLDDAVSTASANLSKLKRELNNADMRRTDAANLEQSANAAVKARERSLNTHSRVVDRLTSTLTLGNQSATDMAKSLSRVTAFSVSASASAAATNASVKAKVEALNKAAAAKAAEVAAALAAQAAQSDPSKKAAAKAAEAAATKAKADAAIADALAKKAASDKAAAAKQAKDRADIAAKQAAAEKESSDAKISAAKAEAVAAAKSAAAKAAKEASDARAAAQRMASQAEDARKRAAKAKQDAENADAQTKIIALERAARLQQQAEDAAKQANLAKKAHADARVSAKEVRQMVVETKKEAKADLNKKEAVPKTMDQLARAPSNQVMPPPRSTKGGQRPIVINNVLPPIPMAQPAPRENENAFLSSTVGSFIGAGFGSLLGTSAGLALHDSKLHEEIRAGMSPPPNSRNMSRYMDQRETQWTRGGPPASREYSDPYNRITEMNEDDPEVARWPGRNLEPVNLHNIGDEEERPRRRRSISRERIPREDYFDDRSSRERIPREDYMEDRSSRERIPREDYMEDRSSRSKNKRHSGECHRSCECSEPLTGYRPNIENDHSRE